MSDLSKWREWAPKPEAVPTGHPHFFFGSTLGQTQLLVQLHDMLATLGFSVVIPVDWQRQIDEVEARHKVFVTDPASPFEALDAGKFTQF